MNKRGGFLGGFIEMFVATLIIVFLLVLFTLAAAVVKTFDASEVKIYTIDGVTGKSNQQDYLAQIYPTRVTERATWKFFLLLQGGVHAK